MLDKLKTIFPMLDVNVEEDERGVTNVTTSLAIRYRISGPILKHKEQAKRAMEGDLTVLRMQSDVKEYTEPLRQYWIHKLQETIQKLEAIE